MAITKTTDITATPRAIDFVSKFSENMDRLLTLMGVSNLVEKPSGANIMIRTATVSSLETSPAEGAAITPSTATVTEQSIGTITIEKYAVAVTIEAIDKYGADIAVDKIDKAFFNKQRAAILGKFYTTLASGQLAASQTGLQATLAEAVGKVKNFFIKNDLSVSGVVAFVNINDFYGYLGAASITVQNENGLFYVKNFLGCDVIILCDDNCVASNTLYATAIDNLIAYHVNPATSDFARGGISYYTDDSGLIGAAEWADYEHAAGTLSTIFGVCVAPEYAGGVCVGTIA